MSGSKPLTNRVVLLRRSSGSLRFTRGTAGVLHDWRRAPPSRFVSSPSEVCLFRAVPARLSFLSRGSLMASSLRCGGRLWAENQKPFGYMVEHPAEVSPRGAACLVKYTRPIRSRSSCGSYFTGVPSTDSGTLARPSRQPGSTMTFLCTWPGKRHLYPPMYPTIVEETGRGRWGRGFLVGTRFGPSLGRKSCTGS